MIKNWKKTSFLLVVLTLLISNMLQPELSYSATLNVPENVQATPSIDAPYLNGSVRVKWDSVSGATAYSVKVSRVGTSEYFIDTVNGESNTQSVLTNLVGGANYSVQVRTIKTIEYSNWSSASLSVRPTTLPKSPLKPTAVVTKSGVNVTWVALTTNELGGGELSSYVVREVNSGTVITASPTDTTASFTTLTNGAKAIFTVTAITSVNKNGSTSSSSDEVTVGEVVAPSASPSSSATPSATSSASPSSSSSSGGGGGGSSGGGGSGGGGSSGGSTSGGGGGGASATKTTDANFIIVDPDNLTLIYEKSACIEAFSIEATPQLKGKACTSSGGLINLQLIDGSYTFHVYPIENIQNFRIYRGSIANNQLIMEDAKFFSSTTKFALTIPAPPKQSPSPSPIPTSSVSPSPSSSASSSPSSSATSVVTISPTASPKPTPTYIATCTKGKSVKKITGTSPKCPSGYKLTSKVIYKPTIYIATCTKGKTVKKITGTSPKCPSGYKLTSKVVYKAPIPMKTIVCVSGSKSQKITAAKPVCPKGYKLKS